MRTLLSLGLAALLAGCALQSSPPYDRPEPSGYSYDDGPLRARLMSSGGRLEVMTSRPAYVAIFEIVPGRGVGLLYPAYYGEDNSVQAGLNTILISRSRLYYREFLSYNGMGGQPMPRYLYMVASDAPLRLTQFIDSPGALRRTLGLQQFASLSPYSLMDQLSGMILPYGARGDWADDVLTIWPERSYDTDTYAAAQWVRVVCPDGRVIEGPIYYTYGSCGTRRTDAPPVASAPGRPTQPGDTAKVQVPTRHRPEEPETRTADGSRAARRPPNIETIPEPSSGGRVRLIPAVPSPTGEAERVDAPRRIDPRVGDRPGREEPQVERRFEPRVDQTPRAEPRREEPRAEAPRPEPRAESPRVEAPRPEPVRVETPRVEAPRPEPRSEAPRVEAPRSEPRTESKPDPGV